MSTRRNSLAFAVAILLAGGVTGCGSSRSSSTGASSATAAASSSSVQSGAESSKSAKQVLADAKSALFNAKAVHVTGTITDHKQEKLDLRFQGQDAAGTETINGMVLHIIKAGGTAYLKAPSEFWTKAAGPKAAVLGGMWIKSPRKSSNFGSLTLQGLAASIDASDSPLRSGVKHASLHGKEALVLTQKDGSKFYVADATPPVPLRIVNKSTAKGQLDFTSYGRTQHIAPPKGAVTAKQAIKSKSKAARATT